MSTIKHALEVGNTLGMAAAPVIDSEREMSAPGKNIPKKCEGYLMKKKKWPMKGWHKRYFLLDSGFLKYAKSPHSIAKNKLHGMMDVGMSVMSTKKNSKTIDLDAEDTIFHIKIKSSEMYLTWVTHLRQHREFRQSELKKDATLTSSNTLDTFKSPSSPIEDVDGLVKDQESVFESCSQDLQRVERDLFKLSDLLKQLQLDSTTQLMTISNVPPSPSLSKKEKKQSKKAAKKNLKAANSLSSASSQAPTSPVTPNHTNTLSPDGFKVPQVPDSLDTMHSLSHSNPDLSDVSLASRSTYGEDDWHELKMSKSQHSTPTHPHPPRAATFSVSSTSVNNNVSVRVCELTNTHEKFLTTAVKVHNTLATVMESLSQKEENQRNLSALTALKSSVHQLTNENQELRSRLQRIHQDSCITEQNSHSVSKRKFGTNRPVLSQLSQFSESQLSIPETASEMFYDAEEYLLTDEDSTTDTDGSEAGDDDVSSEADLSETESTSAQSLPYEVEEISPESLDSLRRSKLPCPRPDTDVSLWNILKKNIGKDLSKVAMPVTLNEPLNALQLLCEELEYSDLLEKANDCDDPYERMMYVAAFAVSAYSSTYYRAGQKPFNPILGETYECIREDRGFRFLAEQVSHHPPISVCHAHGECFQFWQDSRFKNKFWGKSMEIFPIGSVHVKLERFNEVYSWKKVTSCVHNIMSGTRWIEHYGDMVITCHDVTCKIAFSKSGYWNNKSGEVSGAVMNSDGEVELRIHGKWYEGLYSGVGNRSKSIWRPGAMPPDYDRYYGFTRFAVELNELEEHEINMLPRTDTRLRPDQRALEDGDIPLAEKEKQRVEQLQRDQKKERDAKNLEYTPLFFRKTGSASNETWEFNSEYWKLRNNPGFKNYEKLPKLW
uniref:Oxysterol-binding protein-related protein 6 n=1 Tax=Phallusia mammillata TaxID=59560 RepID=A0A6F9DNM4_9ASCI|nr:oxysterol-binding protein-related protein 6 [Phallusia mammillata]